MHYKRKAILKSVMQFELKIFLCTACIWFFRIDI